MWHILLQDIGYCILLLGIARDGKIPLAGCTVFAIDVLQRDERQRMETPI